MTGRQRRSLMFAALVGVVAWSAWLALNEPAGDADQHLLRGDQQACGREHRDVGRLGQQRRHEQRDGAGQHDADPRRHEPSAEHRRHGQAGRDPDEWPEPGREPLFELSFGEDGHGDQWISDGMLSKSSRV